MTGDFSADLAIAIGACWTAFLLTWLATAKMKADALRPPRVRLEMEGVIVEADTMAECQKLLDVAQKLRSSPE